MADMSGLNPSRRPGPGVRRFGAVNWLGLWTLIEREVRRFTKVWGQTLLAPLATAGLFMAVFHFALAGRRGDVMGVPFEQFLAPGVLMMTVIQNAFANTSSSLVISKVQGNIVDTLMPPLSAGEILVGYAAGGMLRGLAVAVAVGAPIFAALGIAPAQPLWMILFIVMGALMLALVGIVAGVLVSKFDQIAAVTNFIVTPLAFLSGTFYAVDDLPAGFAAVSLANPVFHLIDGFRYGVLGAAAEPPVFGALYALAFTAALWLLAWRLIARGKGLKS
jgi:ABC-2 type transport system permease protein